MVSLLELNSDRRRTGPSELSHKRFTGPFKVELGQAVGLQTGSAGSIASVPWVSHTHSAKADKVPAEWEGRALEPARPLRCLAVGDSVFPAALNWAPCNAFNEALDVLAYTRTTIEVDRVESRTKALLPQPDVPNPGGQMDGFR